MATTIGIISDTHGLLRPAALEALAGVSLIIHAGDVGKPDVLEALARVAPVFAVRGNVDRHSGVAQLPETRIVEVEQARLYVLHDLAALNLNPVACGYRAVISGHSHRAGQAWRDGVLYLNPGSAGPRRFRLPITLAKLAVAGARLETEWIVLSD